MIKTGFLLRQSFGKPLCAFVTVIVGYVVFAIFYVHYALIPIRQMFTGRRDYDAESDKLFRFVVVTLVTFLTFWE